VTLPATPPDYHGSWKQVTAPIVKGQAGWPVFALTKGIDAEPKAENLGTFTVGLHRAVRRWQKNHDLHPDGIAGPKTQLAILELAAEVADDASGLPVGLSYGFVVYEGGGMLAATNWWTPPDQRPGVDCGPAQRRLYGPPFKQSEMRQAFNPWAALGWAARLLVGRRDDYLSRRPSLGVRGALRTAVLAHNAPFLAEQIVRNGRLSTPDAVAQWTVRPEGGSYTHEQWMHEYPKRILSFTAGG